MLITLTKLGRNCQVVFYNQSNDNTQTFQEDSANIECTYNVLNDVVSVAIKGRTQATTTSIVDNDVLYINTGSGDILIKTYSDFLINYALLFLNGGGGPGTTPSLQQVVNVGNTVTDNSNIQMFNTLYGGPVTSIFNIFGINGYNQTEAFFYNYYFGQELQIDYLNPLDYEDINNINFRYLIKEGFKFHNTGITQKETRIFADYNVIKTQYLNSTISLPLSDIGLNLDFANNYYSLGNLNNNGNFIGIAESLNIIEISTGVNTGNYTSLIIKDNISTIVTSFQGTENGLKLDFQNEVYTLGDVNKGFISFDNLNAVTNLQNGDGFGFLNFANFITTLGDYNGYAFSTYLKIDHTLNTIITYSSNNQQGLSLDFGTNNYYFGDFQPVNGNTHIFIDDNKATSKIWFAQSSGNYNFKNVAAYTDNADALANGLIVGDIYRHAGLLESQDQLRIVH